MLGRPDDEQPERLGQLGPQVLQREQATDEPADLDPAPTEDLVVERGLGVEVAVERGRADAQLAGDGTRG
ncbi:hypothetical protein LP418_20290 [Nocardioides sp. B-3]|nr:hypothetical protein [Nocardioides sp. B-3]UUZ58492.1 hypothetical protein LP418_20290 [Nocardioides sp. B-3]